MNKLWLILILSLAFFSCARKKAEVDAEFKPYADRFIGLAKSLGNQEAAEEGSYVSIHFSNHGLANGVMGICRPFGDDKDILIDPVFWQHPLTTTAEKEALIFHELGHCAMDRDHEDAHVRATDVRNYFLPVSVMSSSALLDVVYERNYQEYIKELFTGQKTDKLYRYGPSSFPAAAYPQTSLTYNDAKELPPRPAFKLDCEEDHE